MAHFRFDPIGTRLQMNAEKARVEMALVASGVKHLPGLKVKREVRIAHGRTSEVAQPTADDNGQERKHYATVQDLVNACGEENVARWSREVPTPEQERERDRQMEADARQCDELTAELMRIRQQFYADFDIADCADGPPEYTAAVESAVQKHYPTRMTAAQLCAEVEHYLRKLFFLVKGHMISSERTEMSNYVDYFEFWTDELQLSAPLSAAPDLPERTPHRVQTYLKDVRDTLRRILRESYPTHQQAPGRLQPDAAERQHAASAPMVDLLVDAGRREARASGKVLKINPSADFTTLLMLHQANGEIVPYADLARALKPNLVAKSVTMTEAPQDVRDAVAHINGALRDAGARQEVKSARHIGYRLLLRSSDT